MFFKKEKDSDSSNNLNSKSSDLVDAPSSLPNSFIDKYVNLSKKNKPVPVVENPKMISAEISSEVVPDFDTITLKSKEYFLNEEVKPIPVVDEKISAGDVVVNDGINDGGDVVNIVNENVDRAVDKKVISEEALEEYDSEIKHFFKELQTRYEVEKKHIHDHIASDSVLDKLKDFHKSKLSGDSFFLTEKDIDETIYKKLSELKDLEDEWLNKFNDLEKNKAELLEKELEIESKLELFKKTFRKAERFRLVNTKVDEALVFKLEDGRVLRSVKDLIKALQYMDDRVFNHHVNSEKNDFAMWIKLVFFEDELAKILFKEKTKEGMFEKLVEY